MASPNTETDNSAAAIHKKRSRRVSFAEITSVHVFDRDDDSEAPSDPQDDNKKPDNNNNNDNGDEQWELLINRDFNESSSGDKAEYDFEKGSLFLRPDGSPSTAGSTTSNDEDNFFGPVSSSFIRPGRLSDSGASDIHDITMDSTAFSQHFRSLAKSDSGGDLKTPTGVHLYFEDNTPSQNTIPGSNQESSMLMNSAKKPIGPSSTSVEKLSNVSDSNDMSLVEANPNKYDYGRLSFGWEDALLAEGADDVHTDSYISSPIRSPTSINELNHSSDILNKEMLSSKEPDVSEMSPVVDPHVNSDTTANQESSMLQLDVLLSNSEPLALETSPKANSHVANYGATANEESGMPSLDGVLLSKEPDAAERNSKTNSHAVNSVIAVKQESGMPPLDVFSQRINESPLERSFPSLSRPSQTSFQGARVYSILPISTPQNHVFSVTQRIGRRAETVPSIQKSISKLKILDASPFASNLNVKLNSELMSSESLYRTPPCSTSLHRIIEDIEIKHVDASAMQRDQSRKFALENRGTDTISNMMLNSIAKSESLLDGSAKFGTSPPGRRSTEVLASEQSSGLARVRSLVSQLTWSGIKAKTNLLTSEDLTGKIVVAPGKDSVYTKIALDHENVKKAAGGPGIPLRSVEENVTRKTVSTSSPKPKRTREDGTSKESECVEDINDFEKSPKVQKKVGREIEVLSGDHSRSNSETSTDGDEARLQHLNDVLSEFLAKKILPPSVDKLNLQAIGILEDRLVKLQRLQTYEMHHNIIQSQRSVEDLANLQHKRTAEAKFLLHRLVHERAKLQLMRVKQEIMQRNLLLLRHGKQEALSLKLDSLPQISAGFTKVDNSNGSHCQSMNTRGREEEEVSGDKVTELRQLCDTLESKITCLTKSVHSSCKLKRVSSHIDTVSAVNGYLKKKECCKYLRSDLQLWKVHKISTMNGNRKLVINYLDFVLQRITFNAGSASSLTVTNELNDDTVSKSFPNMDASTALSFALNAIDTQNAGALSLAKVTQITSSVLGNLVDVSEEVQQAHFEHQNLTYTRFGSPSVGQLDLNLHFIGMKSGRKVELALDLSCLKWGIYPSDVMPCNIVGSSVITRESIPEQLLAEIKAAIHSVDVGFWRLLHICKAVSQVVQAWNQ